MDGYELLSCRILREISEWKHVQTPGRKVSWGEKGFNIKRTKVKGQVDSVGVFDTLVHSFGLPPRSIIVVIVIGEKRGWMIARST